MVALHGKGKMEGLLDPRIFYFSQIETAIGAFILMADIICKNVRICDDCKLPKAVERVPGHENDH